MRKKDYVKLTIGIGKNKVVHKIPKEELKICSKCSKKSAVRLFLLESPKVKIPINVCNLCHYVERVTEI